MTSHESVDKRAIQSARAEIIPVSPPYFATSFPIGVWPRAYALEWMDAQQKKDEEQFRQVERALLYADDAARKIAKIVDDLSKDGADPHLIEVLQAGSDAVRAEHREMMKRVYFRAPGSGDQQGLLADEQPERLAS